MDLGPKPIFPSRVTLVGANMSFRREVSDKIGAFNPLLGPGRAGQWDDTEFSRRLMKAGFLQRYEPEASVRHIISGERLSGAYFRTWALRQGVSGYIGCDLHSSHSKWQDAYDVIRASIKMAIGKLSDAFSGNRAFCTHAEIDYYMLLGGLLASYQSPRRLAQRLGRGMSNGKSSRRAVREIACR